MGRTTFFDQGEYYHVFNRGVEKRVVFLGAYDKSRFQKLLYICNGTKTVHFSNLYEIAKSNQIYTVDRGGPIVHIGAYCILSNHFHILLKEIRKNGISLFMQKLSTAYTMYFNKRNERTGSLFQGRFRSRHADNDDYLKYLFSYIHLNPVQYIESSWKESGIRDISKAWQYLMDYRFSSLVDYSEVSRAEIAILDKKEFPDYFSGTNKMRKEIFDWLTLKPASADDKRFSI